MLPVCFSGADPVMRESLNAGIGVLLGVTAVVLAVRAVLRQAGARACRGDVRAHLVRERAVDEVTTRRPA